MEKNEATKILKDILEVYPDNNAITFQFLKNNINESIDIENSVRKLGKLTQNNIHNPLAYKLLAEGYEKTKDKYNTKLALINFYNLKGNMPMAFRVIDDGLASNQFNKFQKDHLKNIRINILCEGNPPLSPYLVTKPVIKKCFNKTDSSI